MKELSTDIEENLEEVSLLLSNGSLSFEIDTILKGILLVNSLGATVNPKKFSGASGVSLVKHIDTNWNLLYNSAFQALRDFIVNDLRIDNEKVIRSYNSLVPIFEYLYLNPTPDAANKSRLKSFYYKAQLFNWFSTGTDGILDYLHNNYIGNSKGRDFPMSNIQTWVGTRKKKILFDRNDLIDHKLRFFLLHLLYVESNNTSAFNVALKNNSPHIDHIYPKSKLAKSPFGLPSAEINHIGNYRFVGATDNIRKRAEDADMYFTRLANSGIDLTKHLLIPSYSINPGNLKMDPSTYRDFRNLRADEIFRIIEPKINFI